jgi:hypothetical protein
MNGVGILMDAVSVIPRGRDLAAPAAALVIWAEAFASVVPAKTLVLVISAKALALVIPAEALALVIPAEAGIHLLLLFDLPC